MPMQVQNQQVLANGEIYEPSENEHVHNGGLNTTATNGSNQLGDWSNNNNFWFNPNNQPFQFPLAYPNQPTPGYSTTTPQTPAPVDTTTPQPSARDIAKERAEIRRNLSAAERDLTTATANQAEAERKLQGIKGLLNLHESDSILWDRHITPGELRDLVNIKGSPIKEAAQFLIDNPALLAQCSNGSGVVMWRLEALVKQLGEDVTAAKSAVSAAQTKVDGLKIDLEAFAEVNGPPGNPTGNPATSTANNTSNTSNTTGQADALTTDQIINGDLQLRMGEVTGGDPLMRSTRRLSNAVSGIQEQIDSMVVAMGQEKDPAKQKQIEVRINEATRALEMVSKMQQRLETLLQNLADMYHNITMGSIRKVGQ